MTPFPGTIPEPDPGRSGNSSFDLDSRLHCPILEELLMKRALQFPRIDDMTSYALCFMLIIVFRVNCYLISILFVNPVFVPFQVT